MKQAPALETFTCTRDRRFLGPTNRTWFGSAGTVVYLDGMNRWSRETPDGRHRTFRTAAEAFSGVFREVPLKPAEASSR